MVDWIKNTNPQIIIDRIEKSASRPNKGHVTFRGFEVKYNLPVLLSMLNFPNELSEPDKFNLVNQAIFRAAGNKTITKDNLLKAINYLVAGYLRRPIKSYVLASSLSIPMQTQLRTIRWAGSTLTFSKFLPLKFQKTVNQIEQDALDTIDASGAHLMMKARIHVRAHSIHKAFSDAIDTLDLVRAVWNWGLNHNQWIRSSVGLRKPVNQILLGPLHTLHFPSGESANKGWWYEENYVQPSFANNMGKKLNDLYKLLNKVRNSLSRSNYSDILKRALLQYGRALDESDWTNSFLQLWRSIELLTATSHAAYDQTVRRTAFLYANHEYHTTVLNHLRSLRNHTVHRGGNRQDIEACMYQLKNYVEELLSFHMFHRHRFPNINSAVEMLDLPVDTEVLKKRLTTTRQALLYRKG